jgi:hypothetical protein
MPSIVLATLLAFVAACGGASSPSAPSTAPTTPPSSVASGAPAATKSAKPAPAVTATPAAFVVPAGAAYDEAIGGRYQLITWSLGADGASAKLLLVAAPNAAISSLHTQTVVGAHLVDLRLRDTRLQLSTPKHAGASGGGPIARAALIVPPDDALIVLRLTLASGTVLKGSATVTGPASGRFFLVSVQVKG